MQSLGRPGRGPGEFTYPWEIRAKDGKLHVIDSRQTKISIFDQQTLEHRKDINISLEKSEKKPTWMARTQKHGTHYRPNNIYPLSNDGYLVVFSDNGVAMADNLPQRKYELSLFDAGTGSYPRHDLLSFDWTGKVLVHERERGRQIMFDVPYKRSSQFDVANGRLVHGWTEDFLFKFYDTEGNYQRAFYYPFDREPLSEEKALAHHRLSGAEEAVRNDTLPETWPAFNSVLMDEQGRLWVSIFTEDPDTYKWLVLESSGKLLAEFSWPARQKLQEVQEGFAYTLERDPQTGLHKISRYQIHME